MAGRSRLERVGGGMNRGADPRVRAAPAEVATHPRVDRRVVGRRVGLEQRHRGQRLSWLAVAALHDVAAVPGVAYGVDHRTRGALDRRDGLPDRPLGGGLTRLRVPAVDQDRARRAEAGSTAELRPVQTKHVSDHPQQRGLRVPVVNLDLGVVDDKLHLGPPMAGTCGRCCTSRTIPPTQVSRPHRMMVILPRRRLSAVRRDRGRRDRRRRARASSQPCSPRGARSSSCPESAASGHSEPAATPVRLGSAWPRACPRPERLWLLRPVAPARP